ncbi:nucleoside/nucleotide kinase family protein, partial [Sinorhizobium meliloti]
MSVKSLADEILKRTVNSGRFIVAIAGPPGAG